MLRGLHTLDILGTTEMRQRGISLANAVAMGIRAILHVGHAPSFLSVDTKRRWTLTELLTLKTDVVGLIRLGPWPL